MNKKNIIIILGVLFLLFTSLGAYFLLNKTSKTVKLDKYTELLNLCQSEIKDNQLELNCDALLVNLYKGDNETTCLNTLVISAEKTLTNLLICENTNSITYANEVINSKPLKPIQIQFIYKYTPPNAKYNLEYLNATPQDPIYIEKQITNSIRELTTSQIKNAGNFCPSLDNLPEYIDENTKASYSEFLTQSISPIEILNDDTQYNAESSNIDLIYACDVGRDSCNSDIETTNAIQSILTTQTPILPLWNQELSDEDLFKVKQLVMLYDNVASVIPQYAPYSGGDTKPVETNSYILERFLTEMTMQSNIKEDIYCAMGKLLKKTNSESNTYLNEINSVINTNITSISSPLCQDLIDRDKFDRDGLFLKYYFSNRVSSIFDIYGICINLSYYLH